MQVFTTPGGKFKDTAQIYKRPGEKIRITLPIEFEGRKYREVLYNKTFLGKMARNIEGMIFLTENGEYVSNTRIKRELSSLGYYFENMLDDKSINEIKKAMIPELEIEKQIADYEQIIKAVEMMSTSKISGIDTVVSILNKLPEYKKENNKVIEAYLNKVQSIKAVEFFFNESLYNELYSCYQEILAANFKRVKLVSTGRSFYDDIKSEGKKRRRSLSSRLKPHDVFMGLNKIPVEMDRLKNIVSVYESVLNMKPEEYIKHLKSIEKNNINNRIQLIR